ncbi:MAG: HAD family hydrolase [Synergistaceae bacterium]|jgi:phosphoglycolate phosphatase-like HAD superfamily hydrolase|nr:HAD family hydrolase [Synergistaceae bacterium]
MRLFILVLSMACVALYGWALAGYAGYSFGRGRADYVAWGLSLGTLCALTAIHLWKKWDTAPDMLIFDIDGVLIDTQDSFMPATAEAVRWCWENLLGGVVDCEGYTREYFALCKTYPGFNDDAVVAWTLLRCMKRRVNRTGKASMRETFPTLEEWRKELEGFVDTEDVGGALALDEVRSVLEELYYGEVAYAEYRGQSSRGIGKEGFWTRERPALAKDWKDFGLPVGIYTGRTHGEIALARRVLNWPDFPPERVVSSDDGILKPSAEGLALLCQRSGAKYPLFFGDTASDKEAWLAFGQGLFVAIGPILKAETLRQGAPHYDTLERAREAGVFGLYSSSRECPP